MMSNAIGAGVLESDGSTKPGFTLLFVRDREEAVAYVKPTAMSVELDSLLELSEPHEYRSLSIVSIDST